MTYLGVAWLVLAFATLLSSAASAQSGGAGRRVTDAEIRQLAALLRTADARRADTAVLDAALASSSPVVRAHGSRVAGQVRARSRATALRALLADSDTAVAANAAFSLGLMRDTASVEALAGALGAAPTVAAAAAWSLGEIGDPGGAVLERVLRARTPVGALPAVLVTASRLRVVPAPLVLPYLRDSSIDLRWAAAYTLSRTRPPAAARALLELAASAGRSPTGSAAVTGATAARRQPHEIRAFAARGLARAATGDSLRSEAIAALARLLEDPHPHVRVNATTSIASFGPDARAHLLARLADRDANVRVAAATALAPEHRLSTEDWTRAWRADTAFVVRRALLLTAARSGVAPSQLDPSLPGAWRSHGDWRRRAALADAGAIHRAAFELVEPLAGDADPRVRARAIAALGTVPDSVAPLEHSQRRAGMGFALDDSSALVRATALSWFGRNAPASDLHLVLDGWERARDDRDDDARQSALGAIVGIWRRDSANVSSADRERIARWQPPSDPIERAVLGATPLAPAWQEPPGPPRDLAWYEERVRRDMVPALEGRPMTARLTTERGAIEIVLLGGDAPLTVSNFVDLVRRGYYRDTRFHRVVPNFVVQDGDPRGDGGGGPGYAIRDELNRRWYERGSVGMALSGPDTGGSQYFIAHSPQPHLDGRYTVFGQLRSGWAVLDAIVQGDRLLSISLR